MEMSGPEGGLRHQRIACPVVGDNYRVTKAQMHSGVKLAASSFGGPHMTRERRAAASVEVVQSKGSSEVHTRRGSKVSS